MKFKEGDRVRVKEGASESPFYAAGDQGAVVGMSGMKMVRAYVVQFDQPHRCGSGRWSVPECNLESLIHSKTPLDAGNRSRLLEL